MAERPFREVLRIRKKRLKNKKSKSDFELHVEELRQYYREKGPVIFAMRFLTSPPTTPIHPKLGRIPEHIILSQDQVIYLRDRFLGKSRRNILAAGRGGGKTLMKAVWNCWRLFCFDEYSINTMAGSQGQSTQIQQYIDFWRRTIPEIGFELCRSVGGSPKEPPAVVTRHYSKLYFLPCSEQGSRSSHVHELDLDEVCSAEKTGKIEYMQAALWQVSTSPEVHISMASTAHWIFGMFLEYIRDHKNLNYTFYSWAIAEHISKKPPEEVYHDKDPKHWKPKVWWVSQDFIEQQRKSSSDATWLCECLGGITTSSGSVFPANDLDACICDVCLKCNKECCPFQKGHCIWADILPSINERICGADFGKSVPSGEVIAGRKGALQIFILFAREIAGGTRDTDILATMEKDMRDWQVPEFAPDPAQWGMGQAMEDRGFTSIQLEPDNEERYFNARRIVENHLCIIPVVYQELIKSLRNLVYNDAGQIVKINDHMADTFTYALSEFKIGEIDMSKIKDRLVDRLW